MDLVYDQVIQIWAEFSRRKLCRHLDIRRREFRSGSEQRFILDSLSKGISDKESFRDQTYIGYGTCSYRLLYRVFGIDVIAYLFNKHWIPSASIKNLDAEHFLRRVSVLVRAADRFADCESMPCKVSGDAGRFVLRDEGPGEWELEEDDKFLLEKSLDALRNFGRLAQLVQSANIPLTVEIHFYSGHPGRLCDEIMQYAAPVDKDGDTTHADPYETDPPLDFRWWLRSEDRAGVNTRTTEKSFHKSAKRRRK